MFNLFKNNRLASTIVLLWAAVTFLIATTSAHAQPLSEAANKPPTKQAIRAQPNIVMIISDDQAWTDYGFMDHPRIETPNLDALAKQSVSFRRGYVPTALCRPSLMTMITGLYAHQHGITGNDPSPKHAAVNTPLNRERRASLIAKIDQLQTLPQLLAQQGYACHQSGKWWEGNFRRGGFTAGMTRGFPEKGGRHGDDGLSIGRRGMEPVKRFIDQAVEEEQPFFVWYAPFLPHAPHTPPQRLLDKYRAKAERDDTPTLSLAVIKYEAMCEWFDETCGELLDHLNQRSVQENTLVVYVCDNGWIQSDVENRFGPRSKQTPFDGGVRTPIMFSWPGTLRPDQRTELCSSIDLFPTILAAAGIPQTQNAETKLPGLNLWPSMLAGEPIERTSIFGEAFAHDIADIEQPEASLLFRWQIDGRWKLILAYDGEANRYAKFNPRAAVPQLFDLVNDPRETKNLAQANPEIVARMSDSIAQWYPLQQRKLLSDTRD